VCFLYIVEHASSLMLFLTGFSSLSLSVS